MKDSISIRAVIADIATAASPVERLRAKKADGARIVVIDSLLKGVQIIAMRNEPGVLDGGLKGAWGITLPKI